MKNRVLYSTLAFLLIHIFVANHAYAQDPRFSQFFSSPLTVNPAFTGKTDGSYRVAGNYRNQWPTINQAFQTQTVSIDAPIMKNRIGYNDTWGLGFMGFSDKSAAGAVNFSYATISTSFHKGLDEDGFKQLGVGFQATYANMNINTSMLRFEDQLTTNGFTGITNEIFNGATLRSNYWDVNAGLLYSNSINDRSYFYAGASVYHLNRPRQQFTGGLYNLQPRLTLHSGGYFPLGTTTTLHASALYSSQANARELVVGGAVQFIAADDTEPMPVSFYAGSWYRLNDAVIPYVGLEYGDVRIGATYDVNTSLLRSASQTRGGFELSLIYTRRPPSGKGLPCPKF